MEKQIIFAVTLLCWNTPGAVSADGELLLTRIALGSCTRQNLPQPIWEPIVAAQPDLFLFLGDNIYGDSKDMNVLRSKYAQLAAKPGFQKLRAACPILAIWDDHDYGANDAGAEYSMKVESQQSFLDIFQEPAESPPSASGNIRCQGSWPGGSASANLSAGV